MTMREDACNLNQQPGSGTGGASHTIWRETHSHVQLLEIIGRENDRDAIVERLKCQDTLKNPFIVSIVGFGGLGKTALAKLVYNDNKVEFDERIWVYVSDDFNLKKILQKIVKLLDPKTAPSIHNMDLEQLQANLRDLLREKKFLLVLDDVWVEDHREWNELSDLLTGGNRGSSIIVTTRNSKVASMVGTCYEHKLEGLSHDSCMAILEKPYADGLARSIDHEILEIVGQILKKCGGVPLVVKALGGLLYSNADVRYWRSIKDKDIFTALRHEGDVLPIIKLSYDHLPPHLKRCFHFFSLWPKDSEFFSYDIARYWKSLELIDLRNNNIQNPEVIAEQYMKELSARLVFQDFEDHGPLGFKFKIHDLMHDLALFVASYECLTINLETLVIPRGVQHVSVSANTFYSHEVSPPTPSFLNKANRYRTLVLRVSFGTRISKEFLKAWISSSKYLRLLDLEGSNFEVMPSSIGTLKHLRFINLSGNPTIRRLPDSICNLQSLQALLLGGCEELEELPRNMWKLISLESLHLTTKQKSLKSCGIGSLKSLKDLSLMGCDNLECVFEGMDIKDLTALRRLCIVECGSLTRVPVNKLKFLSSLELLVINDCEKLDMSMDEEPFPSAIRTIWIVGLPLMSTLPKWFLGSADTLESLYIEWCDQLKELPEWLKNFGNLKRLEIGYCSKVASLPDGMQSLTALRWLKISGCVELTDRCQPDGADWNKIAHIPEIEIDGKSLGRKKQVM